VGDEVQQLGHFGLEIQGLLGHGAYKKEKSLKNETRTAPVKGSAKGNPQLWAKRQLFKSRRKACS
jgi:hypothetical protein